MNKIKSNIFLSWLPYLVFFAGSFIYFAFIASYILFYQEKASLFIFSFDFFRENLHQPGGLLIWFGKLLSTFFYWPPAGALIISGVITLIVFISSKIISNLTGRKAKFIPFLIGAALFYLQTDYHFLLFNNTGLLLQLVLFYLSIKYLAFFKGWVPVIISPLCYFATGGFAWSFSLLITFYFVLNKEYKGWIRILALWFLNFIIFWLSKEFLFFQSGKTLLTFPYLNISTGSQQILFLSIAGILSILPLLSAIRLSMPEKLRVSEFTGNIILTIMSAAILTLIGIQKFDRKSEKYFFVEKLFYQNKFDELISYNTSDPPTNSLTIFLNNIALCEQDKLDDLLFHFPQSQDGKTLFLKWDMVEEILKRGGYFYYTIGMINEAHRWAFENMVMRGHSPEGLKMLIKTDLINGNNDVAARYISILKKTLFYRKDAKEFEKLLFNDTAFNVNSELGKKRMTRIENDFFSITDDPYINIEMILASDSLNKKAFEYRMAFMLLKKNYEIIGHELPKFERFGFTRLPIHIEEAAIALAVSNRGKLPDMGNLLISKNTEDRWNQYLSVLQQYNNDLRSAEPALKRRFGDTFWYYIFFR